MKKPKTIERGENGYCRISAATKGTLEFETADLPMATNRLITCKFFSIREVQ